MINVLHFRVHDNKTFMQNHFKAQRLIPQPASLATSMLSCQGREVQVLGGADRWRDSYHTVNIFFFFFSSA